MGVDVTIYEGHEQRTFADVKKLKTSNGQLWVPEGEEAEAAYSNIIGDSYGVIDLSGETFNLKNSLTLVSGLSTVTYNINFVSNSNSYTSMTLAITLTPTITFKLSYGSTVVYENGTWASDDFKQIIISENNTGTDVDNEYLLYWLYKNSTDDYTAEQQFDILINVIGSKVRKNIGTQNAIKIDYIASRLLATY